MKKGLLILGLGLALTSCQDKFEQIDANFAYQQEQIVDLGFKLQEHVSNLQQQINETNIKLDESVDAIHTAAQLFKDEVQAANDAQDQANAQGNAVLAEQISDVLRTVEDNHAVVLQIIDKVIETQASVDEAQNEAAQIEKELQDAINNDQADQIAALQAELDTVSNTIEISVNEMNERVSLLFVELSTGARAQLAEILAEYDGLINGLIESIETVETEAETEETEEENDDATTSEPETVTTVSQTIQNFIVNGDSHVQLEDGWEIFRIGQTGSYTLRKGPTGPALFKSTSVQTVNEVINEFVEFINNN